MAVAKTSSRPIAKKADYSVAEAKLNALYQNACIAKTERARGAYEGAVEVVTAMGCCVKATHGRHEVKLYADTETG